MEENERVLILIGEIRLKFVTVENRMDLNETLRELYAIF